MTPKQAWNLAVQFDIPLHGGYYHALSSDARMRVLDAAKQEKYREPKNANGSRARYFYYRLLRAAGKYIHSEEAGAVLWERFGDTPISDDGDIQESFYGFQIGTSREDIWRWFESTFKDFSVARQMGVC